MKKIICFFLCVGIVGILLFPKNMKEQATMEEKTDKIKIVCMIFPQYDWIRQIVGDRIDQYEITLLLDNGSELHSYQPTVEDIAKISTCDFLFYVGGESDFWVEDALKSAQNPKMKVMSLLEISQDNIKAEEEVEGAMGHSHSSDEEEHEHDEHGEEEIEYDEHIWLSLRNTELAVDKISEVLGQMNPSDAPLYEENKNQYKNELKALDEQYTDMVNSSKRNIILFGDRFPFRYLADDYGLESYAAFHGCSAETEASFETIIFLSEKLEEYHLPAVFVMENTDKKLAKVIIENTRQQNQEILTLHSMQSVTREQMSQEDFSYLSVMEQNLEVLKKALN